MKMSSFSSDSYTDECQAWYFRQISLTLFWALNSRPWDEFLRPAYSRANTLPHTRRAAGFRRVSPVCMLRWLQRPRRDPAAARLKVTAVSVELRIQITHKPPLLSDFLWGPAGSLAVGITAERWARGKRSELINEPSRERKRKKRRWKEGKRTSAGSYYSCSQ